MNLDRIGKLSNCVSDKIKRKPIIILPKSYESPITLSGNANDIDITMDSADWKITDEEREFVSQIVKSESSFENKIIQIYEKLCRDYIYDDNVLSYIKKNDDETFFLPAEYGRCIDDEWNKNRSNHNRRNCFELSRILAQSLNEMIKLTGNKEKSDVVIIWDEAVTHYLVGLTNKDYYIALDMDDFTQIKDLTRIKTDLTLEGIDIFYDPNNKITPVIEKYNAGREKIAKESMEQKNMKLKDYENTEENDDFDFKFLENTIGILRDEYKLDSAGIFEYMKEIIDTKFGARCRKKLWAKFNDNPDMYTRCLLATIDGKKYVIDSTKKDIIIINSKNENEVMKEYFPFGSIKREWEKEPYDGR